MKAYIYRLIAFLALAIVWTYFIITRQNNGIFFILCYALIWFIVILEALLIRREYKRQKNKDNI